MNEQQLAFINEVKNYEQSDLVWLLTEMVRDGYVSQEFIQNYLNRIQQD